MESNICWYAIIPFSTNIPNLHLDMTDFESLCAGKWLNHAVMNAFAEHLWRDYSALGTHWERVALLTTFHTHMSASTSTRSREMSTHPLLVHDICLLPLHVNATHWSLSVVTGIPDAAQVWLFEPDQRFFKKGSFFQGNGPDVEIYLFDSMGCYDESSEMVEAYLRDHLAFQLPNLEICPKFTAIEVRLFKNYVDDSTNLMVKCSFNGSPILMTVECSASVSSKQYSRC